MATIINKPIVKVIETREVTYKKKSFLFFKWFVKVASKSMYKTVAIYTNDENIKEVFLNGKLLN
jgi:hypothetical protein